MTRRRWFQLHLSTLIVLTLVAGGLVWLNVVRARDCGDWARLTTGSYGSLFSRGNAYMCGWPFDGVQILVPTPTTRANLAVAGDQCIWIWNGVLGDFAVGAFAIGSIVFSLEYFIRRRKPPA